MMRDHKPISIADQVFEKLERDILSGKYPQGEILSELRLSGELGVSRTPIREAIRRLEQERILEDSGHGLVVIGISRQEVTSQISQMYNMPEGIYVVSVEEGSAAANAGIMKGDIITKFDGSSISSYSDLQKTLQYYAAGDSVTVTVQRPQNGEYVSIELNLTLGSRPASQK